MNNISLITYILENITGLFHSFLEILFFHEQEIEVYVL